MKSEFLFPKPKVWKPETKTFESPGMILASISSHGHFKFYDTERDPESTPDDPKWRLCFEGEEPVVLHQGPSSQIGLAYSYLADDLVLEVKDVMPLESWRAWLSSWWLANGEEYKARRQQEYEEEMREDADFRPLVEQKEAQQKKA